MISLQGYVALSKVYEDETTVVYRGKRENDSVPVIIKTLKEESPSSQTIGRLKHEYALLQSLQAQGTVETYALESYQNGLAIILEDFGTGSIKDLLSTQKLNISKFLILALHITEALEKIHQHHIIHKDINPSNILWDAKQQIKIIDFGIATTLKREMPKATNVQNFGEGTLLYMSPEQTGRMNRGIDYRTDYYSLGVTFYQMATGILPFQSEDMGELIHQHIAKVPPTPHEIESSIPLPVSAIIMKLLAKTAEERYQGTFGLKIDLQECLQQLQLKGKIDPFIIAGKDISAQFQIPEKLYGREEERIRFLNEFDQASRGRARLVLVSGYSGVGKSTLVYEIYQPLVEKRGYFISGKFDQFKRNIPYAAFIQAIQEFIQQILMESDERVSSWRTRIQNALGENGQVMVDFIPLLTAIIGEQPPAPTLEPADAENRFKQVFLKLIQALTDSERPLVLFLDDCQWADVATLKLLEVILLDSETQHLLIVGAFRSNELNKDHLLNITLDILQKNEFNFETLTLKPLELKHVKELLADALHYNIDDIQVLAEVCYQKTEGNPFFLNQFLQILYKEQLLEFDPKRGRWQWELSRIQSKEVSSNVVEFMAKRIELLSAPTQKILKVAACIGSYFDLITLGRVIKRTPKQISEEIWEGIKEGLILPTNEDYQLVTDLQGSNATYRFLHDRVRQAAYSLIPEAKRSEMHVKIGRMLLKNKTQNINESVHEIVNQINRGIDLLTDPNERATIAELNLLAGKKAKSSIAYEVALDYLEMGIALLQKNCWEQQYNLALALYSEAAEAAYLSVNFPSMEKYSEIVIKKAKNLLNKIKVYEIKIYHLADQNKFKESQEVGLYVLGLLGIRLPVNPSNWQILSGLLSVKLRLIGKKIPDLYNLKGMRDEHRLLTMRIFDALTYPTHPESPKLFVLIIFEIVKASIKYGNAAQSSFGYACYGTALCNAFHDVNNGYQFGQLALRLSAKFKKNEAKVGLIFYTTIAHFREAVNNAELINVFQKGIESNEIAISGYSAMGYLSEALVIGTELKVLIREMEKYLALFSQLGQMAAHNFASGLLQMILNLMGESKETVSFVGTAFNENKMLPKFREENEIPSLRAFYGNKIIVCYIFEEYKLAYENTILFRHFLGIAAGSLIIKEMEFFSTLTYLACYKDASPKEKTNLLKLVKVNQKKLKALADSAPMNFLNKYCLVEAEIARISGKHEKAAEYYDKAIKLAEKYRFHHEVAIANELAAKFYQANGKEKIASVYMQDAHYHYIRWGAIAKARQLEKQYPNIIILEQKKWDKTSIVTTKYRITETLDLSTIMKAASALSREIELSSLLKTLMRIVIESAGAQKGYLLLEKSGQWYIEAQSDIDSKNVTLLESLALDNLPAGIIKYAIRSQQSIVLDDAFHSAQFSSEPYIQSKQPKSVLCLPLLNQGSLSSILYLENNLTTGAFTPTRLELLNLLSSGIAISIENARLYTSMKELNENTIKLNNAYDRFVPHEFLNLLGKQDITDVEIGDQVEKEMGVLFCDVRGFTTLSEKMTSVESMKFINTFLSYMAPVISKHQGFIDKYIGDAIMALYPTNSDDALSCAIEMLETLYKYNEKRALVHEKLIHVGIGINSGLLVLGTIGAEKRMEGTVISDVVNIASRLQELTKVYGSPLLITEEVYAKLKNPALYSIRKLDTLTMKGRSKLITIYEVFNNDSEALKNFKNETITKFEEGVSLFQQKKYFQALQIFEQLGDLNPDDVPAVFYIKRCHKILWKK